jgi:aminoglycoside 6-adenylyltransferase
LRVPKYLIRGELWEAKSREWTMKQHLLVMVEWHAVVTAGYPFDGYHKGRHLSRWVDARTWQQAHEVFGRFEAADAWRALMASVALFDRLATEAARERGLRYPTPADEAIAAHLRTLADEHSAQTSPRIMPGSLVKASSTAR